MPTDHLQKEANAINPIVRQLKRIRLVYRQSSTLSKVLVLSVIVVALAALLTLHLTINTARENTAVLKDQAAGLEQDNQKLEEDIDGLGTANSVVEIAQKLWNLVFPDTVVIEPEE